MTSSSFDDKAATWDDDPDKVARAHAVVQAIRAAVPLQATTKVFEYGAGTGMVSQLLAGEVGSLTLADTSAGMRKVMNEKVTTGVLAATTRIWELDLATDPTPDERFELVITVMTLHHITDLEPVLSGLAALTEPGGHACVVDLISEDGSFHSDGDFDGHHGFDPSVLAGQLETAGFADVTITHAHDIVRDTGGYPVFLASCSRPPLPQA